MRGDSPIRHGCADQRFMTPVGQHKHDEANDQPAIDALTSALPKAVQAKAMFGGLEKAFESMKTL
jgi:hypothetical protein